MTTKDKIVTGLLTPLSWLYGAGMGEKLALRFQDPEGGGV